MKKMLMLVLLMILPMSSLSQTCYDSNGNKIEIPDYAKLVIVPFWIDADNLFVKQRVGVDINDVVEPVNPDTDRSDEWDGECEEGQTPEDADCICERKIVVSPNVQPAWCEGYPY